MRRSTINDYRSREVRRPAQTAARRLRASHVDDDKRERRRALQPPSVAVDRRHQAREQKKRLHSQLDQLCVIAVAFAARLLTRSLARSLAVVPSPLLPSAPRARARRLINGGNVFGAFFRFPTWQLPVAAAARRES